MYGGGWVMGSPDRERRGGLHAGRAAPSTHPWFSSVMTQSLASSRLVTPAPSADGRYTVVPGLHATYCSVPETFAREYCAAKRLLPVAPDGSMSLSHVKPGKSFGSDVVHHATPWPCTMASAWAGSVVPPVYTSDM